VNDRRVPSSVFQVPAVNRYLACRQRLLSSLPSADVVQTTRDIVALHATTATGPYLSLWARVPGFRREMLDEALYEQRALARVLCMRTTLHAVPSDEVPFFLKAYWEKGRRTGLSNEEGLLVLAGLCQEEDAGALLDRLNHRVLEALREQGPSTVRQISQAVPEFRAKVRHSAGKAYAGEFSVGSRLVPAMCAWGLLVRARIRGTWRSNLYEYAALAEWLPDIELEVVAPQKARTWLVRRYVSAFGPVTFEDVQWWTGLSKSKTEEALRSCGTELVTLGVEGLGEQYLMLDGDAQRLTDYATTEDPYVFLLPSLDPYIMGYRDRGRFLAEEHRAKIFDRAGNAVPTVWAKGRVVGAWGQRQEGTVVYRLFEPVEVQVQALLAEEAGRLEGFLAGEVLPQRSHTPFTRAL
jgi:hypothetical protein